MLDKDFGPIVLEPGGMAKKKAPAARSSQKILVSYKADPQTFDAFKEWLEGLAAHIGVPVTIAVDLALKGLAKEHKYPSPPKRLAR